jgi:autoinducer 2 (AI-2) kinase
MGETLSWMARMLFPEVPEPELRLLAEAAQSDYGARGMLSSLGAEVMNSRAPSMPAGQITLTHMSCADDPNPRRHLCRALVEGYASAVRANLEQLTEVSGRSLKDDIYLTGGFSRSQVFARVLADLNGGQVTRAGEALTSAMGVVICAAVASGIYPDIPAAVKALVKHKDVIEADKSTSEAAQKVYADWLAMREAGKDSTTPQVGNHILPYVLNSGEAKVSRHKVTEEQINVLVTASFDETSLNKMKQHMEVEYASFREAKRILTGPGMVEAMQGKQVLVTEVDIVDAKALAQLPDLRVVAACRGNAVNVDVEACSAFGVPVLFAPGRNSVAVADLTVAFILSLARKLTDAAVFLKDPSVTAGNMGKMGQAFNQLQGHELWQKTIGLVGLGAVGRMVAKRLQGFGARIVAADPFATPEAAALAACELVDLDTLLRQSDFVSLHAAVTPETTGMIGQREFNLMKSGAYFINTARAALVDEDALIAAVQTGHLAGAGLDTFNQEPPGFNHPLVQHPNVLSTPHSAGNTFEVASHQGEDVSNALLQLLRGEKPKACLNPDVLQTFDWNQPRNTLSEAEVQRLMDKPAPAVTDLQKNEKAARGADEKTSGEQEASTDSNTLVSASPEIIENMRKLFERFCADMAQDEAVKQFSEDQDVTLAFHSPDIGMDFYIGLHKGNVDAGLGEQDKADVQLAMRAFVLDGMFAGTTDPMNAAMNGEISFMGDAAKAMTIQHLQEDMERIYGAVREEIGDPGDLAAIPMPGSSAVVHVEEGEKDIRSDLLDIVNELYEHYIITATGGNVSVRCPDNPDECWITPSAVFKGDLRPEMMVRITLDGKKVDPMSRSPSSEWGFHTLTLKKKPQANAVIHAHAPNATILANCGIPFLPVSSDAAFFGDIKRVPFIMPGSDELAEQVSEALKDEWAVFMENHGIVVAGKSLRRACDMAQIIERTAEVILGCYQATGGKPPKVLPQEAIDLFRSMGDIVA